MPKGRPLTPVPISVEDRAQLVAWSRRSKRAQALAMRARMILLAAEGRSNTAIAGQLRTRQHTVGKVARGEPPKILDAIADVVLAYKPKPKSDASKKRTDKATKLNDRKSD